jgi:hypothetical protein|tara:strand:+ start:249 stop:563 length:315 start_codon:yes stop_codon:yes gene_type:complete
MGKKRRIMTSAKFDVKHSTHPAHARTEADEAPEVVTAPQTEKVVEVSTPPITATPVVTEKVTMKEVKVEKTFKTTVAKKATKKATTAKSSRPKTIKTKTTSTKS